MSLPVQQYQGVPVTSETVPRRSFNRRLETMVRTNRVKVRNHSELSETALATQRGSADDQVGRRLFKLLTVFCVGHLILSVVTTTTLGVYISEHVRIALRSSWSSYGVMPPLEVKRVIFYVSRKPDA